MTSKFGKFLAFEIKTEQTKSVKGGAAQTRQTSLITLDDPTVVQRKLMVR